MNNELCDRFNLDLRHSADIFKDFKMFYEKFLQSLRRFLIGRILVWLFWILMSLEIMCRTYISITESDRFIIDVLSASLICPISGVHTQCVKICKWPALVTSFLTICDQYSDITTSIADGFHFTYGFFNSVINLIATMHHVPAKLRNQRLDLGLNLGRFEKIKNDLETPNGTIDGFLQEGHQIYVQLDALSNSLMQYYGHVDSITIVVRYQSSITRDMIRDVRQDLADTNTTSITLKKRKMLQKEIGERFHDHAIAWKEMITIVLAPGESIKVTLGNLSSKVLAARKELEQVRNDARKQKKRTLVKVGLVQRWARWVEYLSELEEIEPLNRAIDILKNVEKLLEELQSLFSPLTIHTQTVNFGLEQLLTSTSVKSFQFKEGEAGLIELESLLSIFVTGVESIDIEIEQAKIIKQIGFWNLSTVRAT